MGKKNTSARDLLRALDGLDDEPTNYLRSAVMTLAQNAADHEGDKEPVAIASWLEGFMVGLRLGVVQPDRAGEIAHAIDVDIGLDEDAVGVSLGMGAIILLANELQKADGDPDVASKAIDQIVVEHLKHGDFDSDGPIH